MKIKDVKILWGRAANRCALSNCKIELTTNGEKDTLGEMAHIVSKSADGPRACADVSPDLKDSYDNHILLCPTHHKVIDSSPKTWTVEKLKQLKEDHEKWVTVQLDKESFKISPVDNTTFLNSRKKEWLDFAKLNIWIISSITPLNISEDVIDPLKTDILETFNNQKLPEDIEYYPSINRCLTRPNENGVINEALRGISDGYGYRIQLFRNGHYEFLINTEHAFGEVKIGDIRPHGISEELVGTKIIPYYSIVRCFNSQIQCISNIWNAGLPFNDMLLTTVITNTSSTCLNSGHQRPLRGPLLGSKVSSKTLEYNTVISKASDSKLLCEQVVKRFVNYFGLVIDTVFDEKGQILPPRHLHSG